MINNVDFEKSQAFLTSFPPESITLEFIEQQWKEQTLTFLNGATKFKRKM